MKVKLRLDDEIARLSDALEAKDKLIEWHQAYEAELQRVIEAKDQRIADLEADNERLRAVLNRIANDEYEWEYGVSASEVAREALAKLQEQSDVR